MSLLATDKSIAIIGAGATGQSLLRYGSSRGYRLALMDTRDESALPVNLSALLRNDWPEVEFHFGGLDTSLLEQADEVWVSPGVDVRQPLLRELAANKPLRGDIDIFSRTVNAPFAAITGSNGKSTVTTLLHAMAEACGLEAVAGGNLGTPALDLLASEPELYVLEVSSFQLETTQRLGATVATVLNLSEDHMDRYDSMLEYHNAKIRVFSDARNMVVNRDDVLAQVPMSRDRNTLGFTDRTPEPKDYGLQQIEGQWFLMKGSQQLIASAEVRIRGRHNWLNALAALALAEQLDLDRGICIETLRSYAGLPHRCEAVAESEALLFINDSKATNVGATIAAIRGFADEFGGQIRLLCGGEGKGQDFGQLAQLSQLIGSVHAYGRDGGQIADVFRAGLEEDRLTLSGSLEEALECALAQAAGSEGSAQNLILLSPACASFDQFDNYEHRGSRFRKLASEAAE